MKVNELIKALQDCNPNFEVEIEDVNYNIQPLKFVTSSLYTENNGKVVLVVNEDDYAEYQKKLNKS